MNLEAVLGCLGSEKAGEGGRGSVGGRSFWGLEGVLGRLEAQDGSKLGPKREPKSIEFETNIDRVFNAFWDLIFGEYCSILESKLNQVGIQIVSKIDTSFEKRFFQQTLIFIRKNNNFEGSGKSKIAIESDQKSIKKRSYHGKASWHRFFFDFPVLEAFLERLGGVLGHLCGVLGRFEVS